MMHYDIRRANEITEQIELILLKIRAAQISNSPADVDSYTEALEALLEQYWEVRHDTKLKSVV